MEPAARKQLKYEVNLLMLGLIVYVLISSLVVAGDFFVRGFLEALSGSPDMQGLQQAGEESAVSTIIGILVAFLVLYLMSRSRVTMRTIFRSNRPMTFTTFIKLFCVFSSGQLLFTGFDVLLEKCLNMIGLSAMEAVESATSMSETISMFIYACIVAPLFEELVYRGIAMRRMQLMGRKFAVIISAFLFGVMHANIPQAFFAFFVGLVLGYTAVEYSIAYAILMHFINNFLFGDLFAYLSAPLPEAAGDVAYFLLFGVLTLCGIIVLVLHRHDIAEWSRENRAPKGAYRAAFTSVLMIVFILMHFALSLLLITPLEP